MFLAFILLTQLTLAIHGNHANRHLDTGEIPLPAKYWVRPAHHFPQ